MSKSILFSLTAAVLLSGAALAGSPASVPAGQAGDVTYQERHTQVAFGDLDLNSEAGVAALFDRLHMASTEVCGSVPSISGPARDFEVTSYNKCKSAAFTEALAKVGSQVPAVYRTATK